MALDVTSRKIHKYSFVHECQNSNSKGSDSKMSKYFYVSSMTDPGFPFGSMGDNHNFLATVSKKKLMTIKKVRTSISPSAPSPKSANLQVCLMPLMF